VLDHRPSRDDPQGAAGGTHRSIHSRYWQDESKR
jgi:hypothetical protein